jgi:hypothetical protein
MINPAQYKHDLSLFINQPAEVHKNYRSVKIFMAIVIPSVSLVTYISFSTGLIVSSLLSLFFFLLYRKPQGYKYALLPFICSMAGVLSGGVFLPRLVSAVTRFKEALYGF